MCDIPHLTLYNYTVPLTNEWQCDLHNNISTNVVQTNTPCKQVFKCVAFHIKQCTISQLF